MTVMTVKLITTKDTLLTVKTKALIIVTAADSDNDSDDNDADNNIGKHY